MSLDPKELSKKDKAELIELIEDQDTRLTALEKKVRSGVTEKTASDGAQEIDNAFGLNVGEKLKGFFDNAVKTFQDLNPLDLGIMKELDEYTNQIQQNFGLSKARMSEFKSVFGDAASELAKMDMTEQETIDVIKDAMDGLNSAASLSSKTIIQLGATTKITGVDVEKLAENFRGVGISMQSVGTEMKEVVDYARSVGASVKAISAGVADNLGKMNLYNFDNGVQGLAKMAVTSERMGISMQDTFRIAEELFSPENAINLSAGLQRLGVTANGLLDPLRAMDMAQNDPEALQKEIVNLSKEFTTFNEQTGKMEILPGGKRRLREIANELKIDAGEFAKMSIQAADFDRKLKQIKMPSLAEGDDATKELIASMAQLDASGTATIQVKDVETGIITEKKVEELTPDDINNLKKANEESSKSIEEIAINQLDETKQINALLQSGRLAAQYGKATSPAIEKLGGFVAGTSKSIAQRYRDEIGTTGDVRAKYQQVGGSVEDYAVGFLTQDKEKTNKALEDFGKAVPEVLGGFFDSASSFVSNVVSDTFEKFKTTYLDGNNPTEPQTKNVNVNWTINGDPNVTKNINQETFNKMLDTSTLDPNTKVTVNSNLNGGTAPSAATGRKN